MKILRREEIARRGTNAPHGLVIDMDEGIQVQSIPIVQARHSQTAESVDLSLVAATDSGTLLVQRHCKVDGNRATERLEFAHPVQKRLLWANPMQPRDERDDRQVTKGSFQRSFKVA